MKRVNRLLYHDKYFAFFHWVAGIIFMAIICIAIFISGIVSLEKINLLVNSDIVSLSATIAGFELAGVSLLISLNGNDKFRTIKEIGSDKTIYKLFFHSILLLTISLLVMLIDIYVLKAVPLCYVKAKEYIQYLSVVLFGQGVVFFLSSIRMLLLILK